MPFAVFLVGIFAISFLLGSIPSGVVISRLFFSRDVRQFGSGNIGTTNSFRAMGKVGGSVVFVMDFGKGLLAGIITWALCQWAFMMVQSEAFEQSTLQIIYAISFLGCVWGHIFSPWLHFKGGKGIAVAAGNLFVTYGIVPMLIEITLFALGIAITRKVSVGSLAAAVGCMVLGLYVFWGNWLAWLLVTIGAITVIWAHRGNIKRLINHEESTIGSSRKA